MCPISGILVNDDGTASLRAGIDRRRIFIDGARPVKPPAKFGFEAPVGVSGLWSIFLA
jgi:hypothetical protein